MNQLIFTTFAILFALLECNCYSQAIKTPRKYALLVAINHYQDDVLNHPPLKYPESDAKALRDVLVASDYDVEILLGALATRTAILEKLESLRVKSDSSGCVILGFFGHGVEYEASNEAMFLPFDTARRFALDADGKQLYSSDVSKLMEPDPNTLVGMSEVMDAILLSKAGSKLLLADCCRNNPLAARGSLHRRGVD